MKIVSYRTTTPFDNRGPGGPALSPPTQKSIMPFNNVPTIQDFLSGGLSMDDILPHGGGDWSPGEDVSKSYKEKGNDYKRKVRDLDILKNLLNRGERLQEKWKVKVDGGSMDFGSLPLAQKYMREHGISYRYVTRVHAQRVKQKDTIQVVSEALKKCFLVESINLEEGVKETGSSFCVAPNLFLTCAHVIKKYNKNEAQNVFSFYNATVNLVQNGRRYKASVKAVDIRWDIALLTSGINVEPFEIDTSVSVGEDIIAVGSPHGYENNVSTGSIGSLDRKVYTHRGAPDYMFVDLSIFPGSSGGPVIKENNGKVVGLITLIISSAGSYGLNAALAPKYLSSFLKENLD